MIWKEVKKTSGTNTRKVLLLTLDSKFFPTTKNNAEKYFFSMNLINYPIEKLVFPHFL